VNSLTDQQLLSDYVARRSEPAFTELVRRHIDLVHSVAFRLTADAHAAGDVTQAVFVALAGNASRLTQHPVLAGWLHTTARNVAAKHVRAAVRRQQNEQEAAAMNALLSSAPEVSWEEIAPHLDAAIGELTEPERNVVLLRYFERKTAGEIGDLLSISEDAAQKRVSRAVERLREFFAKRGVSVGAGGLVVVISANAVQAAPVGLAVTISAAALAGTAATTSTLIAATTKTIAMTTLQKTLVTVTVAALAGAGIYEARQAAQLRDQVQALQQQQAPLAEQVQQLQNSFHDATNLLGDLRAETSRLKANPNQNELLRLRGEVTMLKNRLAASEPATSLETAAKAWSLNAAALKAKFEEQPERKIPELAFATDGDFLLQMHYDFDAAKEFGEKEWQSRMAELRLIAKDSFAHRLGDALDSYIAAHDGNLPTSLSELNEYYEVVNRNPKSMDTTILQRYKLVQSGNVRNISDWSTPIIVETAPPADSDYDTLFKFSVVGASYEGVGLWASNRQGSCTFNNFVKIGKFKAP
jgi:RNA polymerase sigma factor (sigma-70 family)